MVHRHDTKVLCMAVITSMIHAGYLFYSFPASFSVGFPSCVGMSFESDTGLLYGHRRGCIVCLKTVIRLVSHPYMVGVTSRLDWFAGENILFWPTVQPIQKILDLSTVNFLALPDALRGAMGLSKHSLKYVKWGLRYNLVLYVGLSLHPIWVFADNATWSTRRELLRCIRRCKKKKKEKKKCPSGFHYGSPRPHSWTRFNNWTGIKE